MGIKPQFAFVIEYVKDIESAKRFYVDVMGLEVERDSPVFVQFHNFAIASDEPLSGIPDPELYWTVDNAEAAFAELSQKAVITYPLTQLPFGKVFGIKDPTGRAQFLIEFSQDRPSRSVK